MHMYLSRERCQSEWAALNRCFELLGVWNLAQGHFGRAPEMSCHLSCKRPSIHYFGPQLRLEPVTSLAMYRLSYCITPKLQLFSVILIKTSFKKKTIRLNKDSSTFYCKISMSQLIISPCESQMEENACDLFFSPAWLPDRSNNSVVPLVHLKYQDSLYSLWLKKKPCHSSYHRWCHVLGALFFFYPPSCCWQPVLLHTFVYNRQQKCVLFHVTAIINLTGQSANNSCCTVFNCSRASGEQHKHPPLLMKQTRCESCVAYLPFYLVCNVKGQTLMCLLYTCLLKIMVCYEKKPKIVIKTV